MKILIADPSSETLEIYRQSLEETGKYSVTTTEGGQDALRRLSEEDFDLGILDLKFSDIDGYKIITSLRQRGRLTPVIVIAGFYPEGMEQRLRDVGVSQVLKKPVRLPGLLDVILPFVNAKEQAGRILSDGSLNFDKQESDAQVKCFLRYGAEQYRKGEYRQALAAFFAVLNLNPASLQAVEGAGFCAFYLRECELAQRCFIRISNRFQFSSRPFNTSQGMEMVPIPGGTFTVGATEEEIEIARRAEIKTMPRLSVASPKTPGDEDRIRKTLFRHQVTLSPFFISKRCLSNIQFKQCKPDYAPPLQELKAPDQPACISREDAIKFCEWLSRKDGKLYRLPTEAEWEYVTRTWGPTWAQSESPPQDAASLQEESFPDIRSVVFQWCHDYYSEDYYTGSPEQDPFGPPEGDTHVVRGGAYCCWGDNTCTYAWNRSESKRSIAEMDTKEESPVCTNITGLRLVCICDRQYGFSES